MLEYQPNHKLTALNTDRALTVQNGNSKTLVIDISTLYVVKDTIRMNTACSVHFHWVTTLSLSFSSLFSEGSSVTKIIMLLYEHFNSITHS